MPRCPSCSSEAPSDSRFCPSCGSGLLDTSEAPTRLAPKQSAAQERPGTTGVDQSRFIPGTLLAGRYRIVGPLGRGGMGEVYRADDLKLGQPVALKFLPEALSASADLLERFYGEVRIARQVSHPGVCRVYDVGEVEGIHYISMEFIDGEDLGSLLRRIGRLPEDKAVEISRQICAGLAAAHDKSVLHRDLKPANVMIDGRGHARIADFGLAGVAEEIRGQEVRSGTPAYMAPEQLAGREVTVRSDLYALGLVLYEVFTGRRAHEAETIDQLRDLHASGTVSSPSSHVRDLDPAVERVILRCLEKDPGERPASALAVAAALPGGDPLAAALAAGETPSPEMVAAAGEAGAIGPLAAWAGFAAFGIMMITVALLAGRTSYFSLAGVAKPPQALEDRARALLETLGYPDLPADRASGYGVRSDVRSWMSSDSPFPSWRERLRQDRPAGIAFWYRESPRDLVAYEGQGEVTWRDPPQTVSGMASLLMDTRGRLLDLSIVPPQIETAEDPPPGDPGWNALLEAADLDPSAFTPADPLWTPPTWADARTAWVGGYDSLPGVTIRAEAASYRGRPVWFRLIGPWTRPERMQSSPPSLGPVIGQALAISFFFLALGAAIIMARRNVRMGRGDRRGAFRIAIYLFTWVIAVSVLGAHHVPDFGSEAGMIILNAGIALFLAAFLWILYVALEPIIRRHWPEGIIAWTRLLAGRFRDPLVGRDILAGLTAGSLLLLLDRLYRVLPPLVGLDEPSPHLESAGALLGPVAALTELLQEHVAALAFAMLLMFFFFLGSIRGRSLVGAGIFMTIYVTMEMLFRSGQGFAASFVLALASAAIVTTVYYRLGLLAAVATIFVDSYDVPLTLDFRLWYAGHTLFPFLLVMGVAAWAAWTAQGRRLTASGRTTPG